MSGFEVTPFGIVPIGTPHVQTPEEAARYLVHREQEAVEPKALESIRTAAKLAPAKPLRPGDLIRSVRVRIREIKAELKHLGALQNELQELERLLQAAKQKPKPSVRPLRSVG